MAQLGKDLSKRLGTQLGNNLAGGSLFDNVIAIAAGYPVFTADRYVVDGVSGKVRSVIDYSDPTHLLDQSDTSKQVAVPLPSAFYNSQRAFIFTGAEWYVSTRAAAAWAFLPAGPVSTWTTATFPTTAGAGRLWEVDGGSTPNGVDYLRNTTLFQYHLFRGGVASSINVALGYPLDTALSVEAVLDAAASPAVKTLLSGRVPAAISSVSGVPAAPALTFRFGINAALTVPYVGTARHLLISSPSTSQANIDTVRAYIRQDSGIVAVPALPEVLILAAGRPVFNADFYVVDGVSGKVRAIVDYSDPTHLLDQANASLQVAIPAPHADFNGRNCFTSTGVEWYRSTRAATAFDYFHNGPSAHYQVFRTTAAQVQVVCETANGSAEGYTEIVNASGAIASSIIRPAANFQPLLIAGSITGFPVMLRGVRDAALSPQATLARTGGGAANISVIAGSPGNASLPLTWLARSGSSIGLVGRAAVLALFPSLSATDHAIVQQYILQTYGVAA